MLVQIVCFVVKTQVVLIYIVNKPVNRIRFLWGLVSSLPDCVL